MPASKTRKQDFPVHMVRQYLEPGPVVLVSSAWKGERNIMTMGWHTVMEFSPSLIGCIISSANHSFELVKKSRECVINLPTAPMIDTVVDIGMTSGNDVDKFEHFGLTAEASKAVAVPSIAQCHASFECRLYDDKMVKKYNYFIWEVVHARVAKTPQHPETLHYLGQGVFMVAGKIVRRSRAAAL